MNLFTSVDSLFASLFLITTALSAAYLIGYTVKLPQKDVHTVNNSIFSNALITAFFIAMMFPTAFFCLKEFYATSASIAVMAGVVCACLTFMSKRARVVLQQQYWL